MSGRTWSAAALLAVAVALPAAPAVITSASASVTQVASHGNPGGNSGHGNSGHGNGNHQQRGKKAHDSFNLGGSITGVDATAGTVTFTVHGGKFKALRNTDLTVTATDSTRVRRNGAATLADLVVGDHVRVKGTRTGDAWTASRITAEAPDTTDNPGGDSGTTPAPGGDTPPAGGDGSSLG